MPKFNIPTRNYVRALEDGTHGLSRQTIIIIAVCASIGGIILCCLLFRTLRMCLRPSGTVPLPPIQPLAHQRERQLAKLEDDNVRAQSWYDNSSLAAPNAMGLVSPNGSKLSLLGKESLGSSPSRHTSFTPTTDNLPPWELDSSKPPSPSFHTLHHESSMTSSDTYTSSSPPMSPQIPVVRQQDADISALLPVPLSQRPRPLSVSSTHSTVKSRVSRGTIRGVPHGRHNQVQIVLPAPLALMDSLLQSHESRAASNPDRHSVVDRWVPVGRDSALTSTLPSSSRRPRPVPSSYSVDRMPASASLASDLSHQPPPRPSLPSLKDIAISAE